MASIRDVARSAGVSIATVSRVLNGAQNVGPELRQSVLRAAEDCSYHPTVRRSQVRSVGLVYTGNWSLAGPYDAACLDGRTEAMGETDYDLTILDLRRDRRPDESLKRFCDRKGVASLVIRSTAEHRAEVAGLADEDFPVVVLGDHFENPALRFVYSESAAASREAVEHLVALGHERIAFAACDRDDGDHLDRLEAYREVLAAHGRLDERLVRRVPPQRADGRQLLRNLVSVPNRPTAVFIADPLVAIGAIIECHELGLRLPEDISIVGFDDDDQSSMVWPRLTAVCQDARALGAQAFRMAVAGASGALPEESHRASAWLDIGETTGPAPAEPKSILGGR